MIDSAAYAGTEIIRRTIGIALAKEVSIMDEKVITLHLERIYSL